MATLILVLSAVSCGGKVASAPDVDATVAAAVAATRTASDVQEKVAATLSAPTPTTVPPAPATVSPTPAIESASTLKEGSRQGSPVKGFDYSGLGQHQVAAEEYTKAIQLDLNDADAYLGRGVSYSDLGQNQLAINDFTMANQLDPGYVDAYNNRGFAYRALGQYTLADADDAKACSLDNQYC